MHATNSGGRTPGSKLPASPSPLLRPDGEGQTVALCLCTGPYQLKMSKLHETYLTRTTGTSTIRRVLQLRISMVCQTGWTMETASTPREGNEPARPAQQGHRSPCTSTAKSLWSSDKAGPWRAVFAARKGSQRPARNCNCGNSTVSPEIPALHMPL